MLYVFQHKCEDFVVVCLIIIKIKDFLTKSTNSNFKNLLNKNEPFTVNIPKIRKFLVTPQNPKSPGDFYPYPFSTKNKFPSCNAFNIRNFADSFPHFLPKKVKLCPSMSFFVYFGITFFFFNGIRTKGKFCQLIEIVFQFRFCVWILILLKLYSHFHRL